MLRASCLALTLACLAPLAAAQDFRVTSTTPADGAVNVPLETTLTFAFTREVALNNMWGNVLQVDPPRAIDLGLLTIGDVNTGQTDLITYEVTHQPSTDYIWFLYGMRSQNDQRLPPTLVRYTTGASLGTRSVRGTVTDAVASKRAPAVTAGIIDWNRGRGTPRVRTALGTPLPRPERLSQEGRSVRPRQLSSGDAYVLLTDGNIFESDEWAVRAAAVTEAGGAFTVPYVRDGRYWPFVVKDLDERGSPFEALGFYDPDGDGQPDAVDVSGADVAGIDLALFSFAPATAANRMDRAVELALDEAADNQLKQITSLAVNDEGTSLTWRFDFYSPSRVQTTSVTLNGLVAGVDVEDGGDLLAGMRTVPAYVDSDAALITAFAGGGDAFLEANSDADITITMTGGNLYWRSAVANDAFVWLVQYLALGDDGVSTLDVLVDMESGDVYTSTEAPEAVPAPAALDVFPAPASDHATIAFALDHAADVRLEVFDILGRRVATLRDAWLPAGRYVSVWDASTSAPGTYLVRLRTGPTIRTGTILRVE